MIERLDTIAGRRDAAVVTVDHAVDSLRTRHQRGPIRLIER